jgi:hypothetical protein
MSADIKHADLLRRLADKVIRDLKPNDDPLCNMCGEFERIWRLADGCHDDDFEAFSGEVNEITADLEQQIVGTVATTRMGLIIQAQLLTHQNFSDDLFPDLVRAVVDGIVALVPDRPASAAKLKPMGGCDADTGH